MRGRSAKAIFVLVATACAGPAEETGAPPAETAADSSLPDDSAPPDSDDSAETGETGPIETGDDTADPVPVDGDGDGAFAIATGGTDCDDQDPRTYPGAVERCDYADRDCDGDPYAAGVCDDAPVPEDVAWATWLGNAGTDGAFGASVAIVGDLDADGLKEPLVLCTSCDTASGTGYPGAVFLLRNRGAPLLATPAEDEVRASWVEGGALDELGDVAAVGDLDGDGYEDVAFTGTEDGGEGGLAVRYGPWDASWPVRGAVVAGTDAWWASGGEDRRWGAYLAGPGDLDGDGRAELLVGRFGGGHLGTPGAIYHFAGGDRRGTLDGDGEAGLAVTRATSDERSSLYELRPAGDFDGDGVGDVLVARSDTADAHAQSVSILDGGALAPGASTWSDVALATWNVPSTSPGKCYAGLGDWDDDGYADVAVHDENMTEVAWPGTDTAGVWVVAGRYGVEAPVPIEDAAVGAWHDSRGAWLNTVRDCAGDGDFDGDLQEDFLLGGIRTEGSGADPAALNTSSDAFVFLFPGRDGLPVGAVELRDVALPIVTRHQDTDAEPAVRTSLGGAIAFADLTGDGLDDALVGDRSYDDSAGAVYVFPGWEVPWDEVRAE